MQPLVPCFKHNTSETKGSSQLNETLPSLHTTSSCNSIVLHSKRAWHLQGAPKTASCSRWSSSKSWSMGSKLADASRMKTPGLRSCPPSPHFLATNCFSPNESNPQFCPSSGSPTRNALSHPLYNEPLSIALVVLRCSNTAALRHS